MIWLLLVCILLCVGVYQAVRWALREDRAEQAEREYEKSTWKDAEEFLKSLWKK